MMIPFFLIATLMGPQSITRVGDFSVGISADPITDAGQAVAVVGDGQGNQLKIGCLGTGEKRVVIAFETDRYLKQEATFYVPFLTIRFDSAKPDLQKWNVEPHQAYIRLSKPVGKFAARVAASSKVVFRLDDDRGGFVDGVFSVLGAREALSLVGRTCKDEAFLAALG